MKNAKRCAIQRVAHLATVSLMTGCFLLLVAQATTPSIIVAPSLREPVVTSKNAPTKQAEKPKKTIKGVASWYGPGFHGRRCSNGERFNMYALTAAHKTLPFGTKVRVTNEWTKKSAIVRITDRGPFIRGREIDLSKGAAKAVGMLSSGTAPVKLEIL